MARSFYNFNEPMLITHLRPVTPADAATICAIYNT
jgi:hypothetical protein